MLLLFQRKVERVSQSDPVADQVADPGFRRRAPTLLIVFTFVVTLVLLSTVGSVSDL